MLSIRNNVIDTDDTDIFKLLVDYTMISGYVYNRIADEFGETAAKDFLLTRLEKMVSEVEKKE